MAIALVSNTAATRVAFSGATSTAIDTTGADFLILGMACNHGYNTTPTDSKSNSWTQLTSYTQTNVRVRLWYSIPSSVGTGHTFTCSGALIGHFLVGAFSGVAQTTPADQQNGSNGFAGSLQPGSITPTEDNELIWTHYGINAAGVPISIDSGFTEIAEADFVAGESYGGAWAYKIQTTAAAVNPTWTRTGTNGQAATQASFKAAAAVSAGAVPKLFTLLGVGV